MHDGGAQLERQWSVKPEWHPYGWT